MATVATNQEQRNQDACTAVATTFTAISIIIVALRVYARRIIVRNFGTDDWMIVFALLLTIAYLIDIYVLRANGMGFSGGSLTLEQMQNLIKTTLSIEIFYYILIFCIKASILFFYLRIAAEHRFALSCKITIGVLAAFCIICVVCCLAQCIPLHKMWDFTNSVPGHCISTTALFYFSSSFNIVTDMWILALPIKTLLKIQRPNREKAALIIVFGLGVFSCIASIVRLHSIRIYTESSDPFYDSVPINLWSMVEVNIGIWCASIPSLKVMFFLGQRSIAPTRPTRGYQYEYHSREKSAGKMSERVKAKVFGASSSGGSQSTSQEEAFDMTPMSKEVQQPKQAVRKDSRNTVEGERTGSEDRIVFPGAYLPRRSEDVV